MSKADYEYMIREDKKCKTCTRMTVSQDEYISGLEEQLAELQKDSEEKQNAVKEILAGPNTEIGQIMEIVGLGWYDKETVKRHMKTIEELEAQIEKMKNDQKTAFIKGMRHFAKAVKKYDQTEGACTDYLEHTVNTVLIRELAE